MAARNQKYLDGVHNERLQRDETIRRLFREMREDGYPVRECYNRIGFKLGRPSETIRNIVTMHARYEDERDNRKRPTSQD